MSRWQAIVFDLDDTLYPERDYVLSGFAAVAQWAALELDIPAVQGFAELRDLFNQGVRGNTFDRWLATHNLRSDAVVSRLIQVYRGHQPCVTPFPEVPALLGALRRRFRVGLVSDGYYDVQQRKLAALGLAGYLDAIVFSDEWGREFWKPSTRPFEVVLQRLGLDDPGSAVYVADNPAKDFFGARRAGMSTIWLRRVEGEYARNQPRTPEFDAHTTIRNLVELEAVLTQEER